MDAELVDLVGADQNIEPFRKHRLHDRGLDHAIDRVAGGVVDRSLVGTHAFDVFIQRDHFPLTGRIEQKQIGELTLRHAVRGVDSQLDAAAEIGEERLVGFAIRIAHAGEL